MKSFLEQSKLQRNTLGNSALFLVKSFIHKIRKTFLLCFLAYIIEIAVWKKSCQQKSVSLTFISFFQEVEKQCRCGKHTKRMPCHKPYLCETKCVKMRDCQKHQCRRKVCVINLGNWFKNSLEFFWGAHDKCLKCSGIFIAFHMNY